ncbi:sulfite exporter TauE/SafE family protein [Hydrogenivirga sp.]
MNLSSIDLSVFFLAWFFQAFTGFGAGIFIVGILSLIYDPKVVIVSSAVVNLFGTAFMSVLLFKRVKPNWSILSPLILGAVPGIFAGTKVLLVLDKGTLRVVIGAFILFLGVYDLLVQRGLLNRFSMKENPINSSLVGFVGGFFAGLIGMGGPPPVVYLNQVLHDVDEFKTTLTLFFTSNILFRLVSYGTQGGIEHFDVSLICAGALSIPPAVYLGILASRQVKPSRLKVFISLSVILLGTALVINP